MTKKDGAAKPTETTTTDPVETAAAVKGDADNTDWRAHARTWEQRAKDNEAKLKAIEDANKTEAEKLTDRIAALETATAKAESEALRLRIASKHGITGEDVELFLTGTDESTLEAQAKALAARIGEQTKRSTGVAAGEGSTTTNTLGDKPLREITKRLFETA